MPRDPKLSLPDLSDPPYCRPQHRIVQRGSIMLPLLSLTLSLLTSRATMMSVPMRRLVPEARMAQLGDEPSARSRLSATLLQSKRPLGRNQITREAVGWMQREMRWLAQDYILAIEQETLGFLSISEEAMLIRNLRSFSVAGLQAHLRHRLHVSAPASTDAKSGAEIATRHVPTIWSAFQSAVRDRLQQRARGSPLAEAEGGDAEGGAAEGDSSWRSDLEWTMLAQIRAHYDPIMLRAANSSLD